MDLGIPEVKFFPWVGGQYNESGYRNRKLLILGESEYQRPPYVLEPELVSMLIRGNKFRFYTKVYHSISDVALEDTQTFWNAVAFYNYVQEAVGTGPRQRPTPDMWAKSKLTLLLVLEKLSPDRVLVLGSGLWWNLCALDLIEDKTVNEGCFYLRAGAQFIKTAHMLHPASFGFKPVEWRNTTSNLLR
jgi:hypothetical protein